MGSPTNDALIQALVDMFVEFRAVPSFARPYDAPGVRGYSTDTTWAYFNTVVADGLTAAAADEAIDAAIRHFHGMGKAVSWIVGPTSTPEDLAERLERAGFVADEAIAGMARVDLTPPSTRGGDLVVRAVTAEQMVAHAHVVRDGFGMPAGILDLLKTYWLNVPPSFRTSSYLAFDRDGTAVAYADLVFVPGTSVALLGGAATLPEHRGRGAYTALVAARLADAERAGAEAVIIQANRATSAPIAAKLGFEEIASFRRWVRTPDTSVD